MKQLQLISLALTLIVSFNAQAQNLAHETAQHQVQAPSEKMVLAGQFLTAMRTRRESPKVSQRFYSLLRQEVNAELQSEAQSQNMTRDEYLAHRASFRLFTLRLKDMQLGNMTPNDLMVALIKTNIRNDEQVNADNSLMTDDTVSVFQQSVLNRLGIVLEVDPD